MQYARFGDARVLCIPTLVALLSILFTLITVMLINTCTANEATGSGGTKGGGRRSGP